MLLLACLLAATLLGAGIGACAWHLRLAGRHAAALDRLRDSAERERLAFDAMFSRERESATLKHDQERRRTLVERERAERALARNEALSERAREWSARVETLEASMRELEGRHARLRRELANERDGRRRAPGVDDRFPVLNRRVDGVTRSPASRPPLSLDDAHDIPTLSESELPENVDELVLELLDADDLVRSGDD